MTLLDFARGPGLQISFIILMFGVSWRLAGTVLQRYSIDNSPGRHQSTVIDSLRTMVVRSMPVHQFEKHIKLQHYSGYLWHIGLFTSVLMFAPHIQLFKSVLGFGWPALPNSVILICASLAIAILLGLTIRRLTHPVHRLISTADDYISVFLTVFALLTGILAYSHLGLRYELMLAIHLLSAEALIIWFPFGKLIHTLMIFPSRYQIGATYGHRGVKA